LRAVRWDECKRPKWKVVCDMLYIFFKLRSVPEHYAPYRLWEVSRGEWPKYYGSPYPPIQRTRIARGSYPFEGQSLYNDKVLGARMSEGLEVRQPRILGSVETTDGWRDRIAALVASADSGRVMLKPIYGRSGIGIVLAERGGDGDGVVIRTREGTTPL